MKTISIFLVAILIAANVFSQHNGKNILYIMSDDFNYWMSDGGNGYYPHAKTPNLDALANKGVHFTKAYNSSPVCWPSRNAIWSGYRPTTTGIDKNGDAFVRDLNGFANITSMNQYFCKNGYWMYGVGKLWHPTSSVKGDKDADAQNWDTQQKWSELPGYNSGCNGGDYKKFDGAQYDWSGNDAPISTTNCQDHNIAVNVSDFIRNYNKTQPFYVACGFFRPHAPFNSPKSFWDEIAPDANSHLTPGPGVETKYYTGNGESVHNEIVNKGVWPNGIHAYLASMRMTDYHVGMLLQALEDKGLADNTIVVFSGDHGWHLGEHGHWGKFTRWVDANQTTFIIYDSDSKGNGEKCHHPVCLQDIYPTLRVLTGLQSETDKREIEGYNLKHLLDYPDSKEWDLPVVMRYSGGNYIAYKNWWYVPGDSKLFDLDKDPYEWNNLNGNTSYSATKSMLQTKMNEVIAIGNKMKSDLQSGGKVTNANMYDQPEYNVVPCTNTVAPSVPGTTTVSSSTDNSVEISWGASTDDEGKLAKYEIFVDGSYKTQVNSSSTSATISGLNCETTYSIQVRASDECGNESALNLAVSGTTSACPPCAVMPSVSGGNGAETGQSAYIAMNLGASGLTILAENVDNGDNGVAYYDFGYGGNTDPVRPTWSTEHGFRLTSDIEFDDDGTGNTIIGGINIGEWAEYTINVTKACTYKLTSVKYSTNTGVTGKLYFKMGSETSCVFDLPNTDKAIATAPVNFEFDLTVGEHVLAWISEAQQYNLDEFTIEASPACISATNEITSKRVHEIMYLISPFADENKVLYINLLHSNPTVNIAVYDLKGREMMKMGIPGEFEVQEIQLPKDMAAGSYVIRAYDDENSVSYKFIVK
jgi:arylsulfatase A-like enzyme